MALPGSYESTYKKKCYKMKSFNNVLICLCAYRLYSDVTVSFDGSFVLVTASGAAKSRLLALK